MVFRNGDLTDAAELIDSAQASAKFFAERCERLDRQIGQYVAEIDRLWEAIMEYHHACLYFAACHQDEFAAGLDRLTRSEKALREIARKGR